MPPAPTGPDFLCIGLQVAGTAWLFDQLDVQADFWMPPIKELHYFDRALKAKNLERMQRAVHTKLEALNETRAKQNRRPLDQRDVAFLDKALALRGRRMDLEAYADLFVGKGELISGDITPAYSTLPDEVIEQIVGRFPGIKVALIVRDPIDRNWSQMNMQARQGKFETDEIRQWQTASRRVTAEGAAARSFPSQAWRRWSRFVPEGQRQAFFFDDLKTRPEHIRAAIITFLGGDPAKPSGSLPPGYNRKAVRAKTPMSESVREGMVALFGQELRDCAETFGGAATEWPAKWGVD